MNFIAHLKLHFQYFHSLIPKLIIVIFFIILLFFIPFVFAFVMLILPFIFILLTTISSFRYDYINQTTPKFISIIVVIHLQYFESLYDPNSIKYSVHFKFTIDLAHYALYLFNH